MRTASDDDRARLTHDDRARYTHGQLTSSAIMAGIWVIFYLVLSMHGLTSSDRGLKTAEFAEAAPSSIVSRLALYDSSADPFER